jgi:hypothetical protein
MISVKKWGMLPAIFGGDYGKHRGIRLIIQCTNDFFKKYDMLFLA